MVAVVSVVAAALAIADAPERLERPTPAGAWPGRLTDHERAAVVSALERGDARARRIALGVAAGEAGPSAPSDAARLHHHGVDTARSGPRAPGEAARQAFNHGAMSAARVTRALVSVVGLAAVWPRAPNHDRRPCRADRVQPLPR